jgi:hypothetical protein
VVSCMSIDRRMNNPSYLKTLVQDHHSLVQLLLHGYVRLSPRN